MRAITNESSPLCFICGGRLGSSRATKQRAKKVPAACLKCASKAREARRAGQWSRVDFVLRLLSKVDGQLAKEDPAIALPKLVAAVEHITRMIERVARENTDASHAFVDTQGQAAELMKKAMGDR